MCKGKSSGENPFSTRRVRPGTVEFIFPDATGVEDLIERLQRNRWRGEIVGPHGSGKSTLLYRILNAIKQTGCNPVLFELHDRQRRMPRDWRQQVKFSASSGQVIVVVDGYEQLDIWNRFWLNRYCQFRKLGLLVTSHSSVGLPELFRTNTSIKTAQTVVERLMKDVEIKFSYDVIRELFDRHRGDMRELLFDLYDMFERQKQN